MHKARSRIALRLQGIAFLLSLLLASTNLLFSLPAGAATTLVVSPTGISCLEPAPADSLTIQGAVNAAQPGDTIDVCPGTYEEKVEISKPLTLRGISFDGENFGGYDTPAQQRESVIEAVVKAPDECPGCDFNSAFNINDNIAGVFSQPVTIKGFTITGALKAGIEMRDGTGNQILNNKFDANRQGMYLLTRDDPAGSPPPVAQPETTISGNVFTATVLNAIQGAGERVDNLLITNNAFSDNTTGVNLAPDGGTGIRVTSNTFLNNETSIMLLNSSAAEVANNVVTGGDEGIWLVSGNTTTDVFGNSVTGTTVAGILSKLAFGKTAVNVDLDVTENTIDGNAGDGIQISDAPGVLIEKNIVTNNGGDASDSNGGDGIEVRNTNVPDVFDNTLEGNETGISFQRNGAPWAIGNEVHGNNNGRPSDGTGILVRGDPFPGIFENNFSGHGSSAITFLQGPDSRDVTDAQVWLNTSNNDDSFAATFDVTGADISSNDVFGATGSAIYIGGSSSGIRIDNNLVEGSSRSAVRVELFPDAGYLPNSDVTVHHNHFVDNGQGLKVVEGGYAGTLEARSNRIVANDIGVENGDVDVVLLANNNWWGCNGGPGASGCDTTLGGVAAEEWLRLELVASYGRLLPGQSSNLKSSIRLAGGEAPDGTPSAFATDRGQFLLQDDEMFDGLAKAILFNDGSSEGDAHPSVTVDNQTVSTTVIFDGDADGDEVGDNVDNCPDTPNGDQTDTDEDGEGDACELPIVDSDLDGVPDADDNCPAESNPDQLDRDEDGTGDACEPPPPPDGDGDGIPDAGDNCPSIVNAEQTDTDGDGAGDACDPPTADVDGDGVTDSSDNCPVNSNAEQSDVDSDGRGDTCDDFDNRTGDSGGSGGSGGGGGGGGSGGGTTPTPTPSSSATPSPAPSPTPSSTPDDEVLGEQQASSSISIRFAPRTTMFRGRVTSDQTACISDRTVILKKMVAGKAVKRATVATSARGVWKVDRSSIPAGRWLTVVKRVTVPRSGGSAVTCLWARSLVIRPRAL